MGTETTPLCRTQEAALSWCPNSERQWVRDDENSFVFPHLRRHCEKRRHSWKEAKVVLSSIFVFIKKLFQTNEPYKNCHLMTLFVWHITNLTWLELVPNPCPTRRKPTIQWPTWTMECTTAIILFILMLCSRRTWWCSPVVGSNWTPFAESFSSVDTSIRLQGWLKRGRQKGPASTCCRHTNERVETRSK